MKKFLINNWREIIGWLVIITFGYLYLFQINNMKILALRTHGYDFLVITTIFILAWLKINDNKNHE